MNPCKYFLWGYLKNHVYYTNPHNIQVLQAEIEGDAEDITGDIAENSMVHLR
jgi:hypothetical protein